MKKQPKELRTEVTINATPQKVWSILMDFEKYPQWNPFITSIKGKGSKGAKLAIRLQPPGAGGMTIKPTVLVVEPQMQLRWLGHLLMPGIFDGEHIFELQDNGKGGTHFIHRELFSGFTVPLFGKMLDVNTRAGFELMNEKLKVRAEAA